MLGMLHKTNTITGASHLGAKPFISLCFETSCCNMEHYSCSNSAGDLAKGVDAVSNPLPADPPAMSIQVQKQLQTLPISCGSPLAVCSLLSEWGSRTSASHPHCQLGHLPKLYC